MGVQERLFYFVRSHRLAILGCLFVLIFAVIGVTMFARPQSITAATNCPQSPTPPQFNVVFCGISGNTAGGYITSFQNLYTSNNDGHGHTDLPAAYSWGGATAALVSSMDTSNTMLGTVHSDGTITVNGQTVGNNAWVAGRWNGNGAAGFVPVEGDVWARAATTYLSSVPQVQVLVHFNPQGQADFAVMTPCGNALKFTPTTPPKSLTCDQLQATEVGTTLEYTFTAQATAQNVAISSFTFDFGDGATQSVPTTALTASTTHTYVQHGQPFTASVSVNGSTTSNGCKTQIVTPQANLTCQQLTATKAAGSDTQYTFTAAATSQNTTIASYVFNFGDNMSQTVTTGAQQASVVHTYAASGPHTATVSVNGVDAQNVTSTACTAQIIITPPASPPPAPLINTGPGSVIGVFGITSAAGGLFHRFVLRRRILS